MKPTLRTLELPKFFTRAEFKLETLNKEDRTVDVVWTTGARVRRSHWLFGQWEEELSLEEKHVRMGRLQSGNSPFLAAHNLDELGAVLGVIARASLSGQQGIAQVRFSPTEDVDLIYRKVEAGILRNISVGYQVYEYEEVAPLEDGAEYVIPVWRAIDWEPCEISLVPVGADFGCHIRGPQDLVGRSAATCRVFLPSIRSAGSADNKEKTTMALKPTPENSAAPVTTRSEAEGQPAAATTRTEPTSQPAGTVAQPSAEEVTQAERTRAAEIFSMCRASKLSPELAEKWIKEGLSVDKARAAVIDALAAQDSNAETRAAHNITVGREEHEVRTVGMQNALLHRCNPATKLSDEGRQFRGMTFLRMAEEIIGSKKARGASRSEIARRALSTSDFPLILANVARLSLHEAYKIAPQTFRAFVRPGTLPDYKEATVAQFGDVGNLLEVKEGGEYKEVSIGEKGEKVKLAKHGIMVTVTEEMIVNDSMDALGRLPQAFGGAAARRESYLVWDGIFLANPKMGDGVALFHATHGNLGDAAAIAEAGLTAMKKAIRAQKTVDGKDNLDLQPKFLWCGPDKETEARKMLSSLLLATASSTVNIFANSMDLIVENRVTGNKWGGIADPSQIPTIEILYLEGEEGPQLFTDEDFKRDGVRFKLKHVVSAKAMDHRGLFYNPGA